MIKMGKLQELREKTPNLSLYEVSAEEFSEYGRILPFDGSGIAERAKQLAMPESGSVYLPAVEGWEALPIAKQIEDEIFGTLPAQIGYCYGQNDRLNAAEWHASSEVNVAVTDLVLILGRRQDIGQDGKLQAERMKAFFLPAGTVAEIYATTLHFCPCQTEKGGFGCVVGLPAGTNLPLEKPSPDPLLFRRNKWLLAHENNAGLIARGAVAGITGENYEVRY